MPSTSPLLSFCLPALFLLPLFAAGVALAFAENSVTWFGTNNYIECSNGSLPVILTAPHGGDLMPSSIPNRTYGTTVTDSNTRELTRKISDALFALTGRRPYMVLCHLNRLKLDANREIVEAAQGNAEAELAYNEFHGCINQAKGNLTARFGYGALFDIHRYVGPRNYTQIGLALLDTELNLTDTTLNSGTTYRNKTSFRNIASRSTSAPFATFLRGANSFGDILNKLGYDALPSPMRPTTNGDDYFDGGYISRTHGSRVSGVIDAIQLENQSPVLSSTTLRNTYGTNLATAIKQWFAAWYKVDISFPEYSSTPVSASTGSAARSASSSATSATSPTPTATANNSNNSNGGDGNAASMPAPLQPSALLTVWLLICLVIIA